MSELKQEFVDRFYWANGKCCAGCDWWGFINTVSGLCTRRAPQSQGFPITARDEICGDFQDEFDWQSLPLAYLTRIGFKHPHERTGQ